MGVVEKCVGGGGVEEIDGGRMSNGGGEGKSVCTNRGAEGRKKKDVREWR